MNTAFFAQGMLGTSSPNRPFQTFSMLETKDIRKDSTVMSIVLMIVEHWLPLLFVQGNRPIDVFKLRSASPSVGNT